MELPDVPEEVEEAVVSGGVVGTDVSEPPLVPEEDSEPEVPGLMVGSESFPEVPLSETDEPVP